MGIQEDQFEKRKNSEKQVELLQQVAAFNCHSVSIF